MIYNYVEILTPHVILLHLGTWYTPGLLILLTYRYLPRYLHVNVRTTPAYIHVLRMYKCHRTKQWKKSIDTHVQGSNHTDSSSKGEKELTRLQPRSLQCQAETRPCRPHPPTSPFDHAEGHSWMRHPKMKDSCQIYPLCTFKCQV